MRKMKLELDALEVESFTTGGPGRRVGTIKGFDSTTDCTQTESGFDYCAANGTWVNYCPPNSNYTCQNTCRCSAGVTYCGQDTCDHTCPPQNTCVSYVPTGDGGCCPYTVRAPDPC